jgi:hypothetical protein
LRNWSLMNQGSSPRIPNPRKNSLEISKFAVKRTSTE